MIISSVHNVFDHVSYLTGFNFKRYPVPPSKIVLYGHHALASHYRSAPSQARKHALRARFKPGKHRPPSRPPDDA